MASIMNEHSESVFDLNEALRFTAGDPELLRSVIAMFLEEGPRQLQDVETCMDANDRPGTAGAAHKLKGSIVIFGAHQAVDAAIALEVAAIDDSSNVTPPWVLLQTEMKRLFSELEKV